VTDEEVQAFVEERTWVFAKTQPWNPHEYTVRRQEADPDFLAMVQHIYAHGFTGRWGKRNWPYLDVGEWTLYCWGAEARRTEIINRKPREKVEAHRDTPAWNELEQECRPNTE
jgi:hypothetical protein